MSGSTRRTTTVTLARDAVAFIDEVEDEAKRDGLAAPGLNHWAAAACSRTFLALTIAREHDIRTARARVQEALDAGTPGVPLPPSEVVAQARETAIRRGDSRIHAWHLVRSVLQRLGIATRDDGDAAPGSAPANAPAEVPRSDQPASGSPGAGRTHDARRATRTTARGRRPPTPMLDQCGTDWTLAAARGALPPMVGREAEMRLLVEGLCRPTKPNVLLVGEPGVGKSAIVEGLAQRIAAGRVPAPLAGRPLIALDMAELTRESRYYGVMEQRLAQLIAEARVVRAILFIDEGHAMTGSGGREGTGDVASVFKPVLARGELSLISATTEDEYRRFIAPNGALERRFNVVHVAEPARDAVRAMLIAHRDAIAAERGVMVGDPAIDRLLDLSSSRLSHRREPDRSRDLLDQAVARAIATEVATVTVADMEATALAVSGVPDVTDEMLRALRDALVRDGLARASDAAALVDRLGLAFTGLAFRPRRPRATILVVGHPDSTDATGLAERLATHLFGGPEQVITIGVGGITEATAISGFVGTTQGYIGHGVPLPIHGLAERPNSVLLLRGIDTAHEALRTLLARAVRDGYLTDAQGRRIALSAAIVVLEAVTHRAAERTIGFGAPRAHLTREPGEANRGASHGGRTAASARLATAAVGEELAAACDLVLLPPAPADARGAWVANALGRLAETYRSAGVELSWEPAVEAVLADELAGASMRERERVLETRVGGAVRPALPHGRRPVRAFVRGGAGRLVAEVEG